MIDKEKFEQTFLRGLGESLCFPEAEIQKNWTIKELGVQSYDVDALDIVEALMYLEEEMELAVSSDLDDDLLRPDETVQQLIDRLYAAAEVDTLCVKNPITKS